MTTTPTPTHLLPTSCHVCGAPVPKREGATRPDCGHDLTNAEADHAAAEYDRRHRFAYSTGASNVEGHYVDQMIGR